MCHADPPDQTPPPAKEYAILPAVETPPPSPLLVPPPHEDPRRQQVGQEPGAEATWRESRQFSLKQLALVTALLSLMLAPTQWLGLAAWAGVMGLASLAFLILVSLVSIRRDVVLLLASLLLTVYVAAAVIAVCLS